MPITKTFVNKLGADKDKYDTSAYAKDSTPDNFKDDYGFVPKSDNERLMAHREATLSARTEYNKMQKEAIQETPFFFRKEVVKAKPKKEINAVKLESGQVYVYKKGFQGGLRDTKGNLVDEGTDIRELKKLAKEKRIAHSQVKELLKKKPDKIDTYAVNKLIKQASVPVGARVSQKLRADRLAKKELRAAEMKARLRRFQKAERTQAKVQRALSRALNRRRTEVMMSRGEVRQMYAQNYSGQNDGNIMHTPNHFTSSDGREHSMKTYGNILQAQNLVLSGRKEKFSKQKWL